MIMPDLIIQTLDYIRSGGGVIIPLIVVSVWMWTLILKKWIQYYQSRSMERPIQDCLENLDKPDFQAAPWQMEILQSYFDFRRHGVELDSKILSSLRRKQEDWIDGSVQTILVLAAIAPLLGLLGTVAGMITTFDVIAKFGTGNAKAMASGISEALVTTQTGLVVAVPGLVLGNFLKKRAESIKGRMERFCLGMLMESEKKQLGLYQTSTEVEGEGNSSPLV